RILALPTSARPDEAARWLRPHSSRVGLSGVRVRGLRSRNTGGSLLCGAGRGRASIASWPRTWRGRNLAPLHDEDYRPNGLEGVALRRRDQVMHSWMLDYACDVSAKRTSIIPLVPLGVIRPASGRPRVVVSNRITTS